MTFLIRHKIIILFFISCFICFPKFVQAENNVVINEFLIDPQPQQVELYNISSNTVDISGWFIDDSGGSTYFTIPTNTILGANSCVVFSADFSLNKTSADSVRLFDSTGSPVSANAHLIDSYAYPKSIGSGISYMRIPDSSTNWATGSATLGRLNQTGDNCIITPSPSPTLTPPSPQPEPTVYISTTPDPIAVPTSQPINNIIITEVMAYPETNNNEWVELYNNNNFSVSLNNWFIDDAANTGSVPKVFTLEIAAHTYNVINISTSMFNNDGDTVRILDSSKNEKDSIEYESTTKGKSIGRVTFESDTFCDQNPSPGQSNNSCIANPTIHSTHTTDPSPSSEPSNIPAPTITDSMTTPTSIPNEKKTVLFSSSANDIDSSMHNSSAAGEVLGTQIRKDSTRMAIIQSLSYIAAVFSLLGIISVLVKIKNMA